MQCKASVKYVLLLFPVLVLAQTHNIRGYIFEDSTYQAWPFATIRVENTAIVTSSNNEGRFILNLPLGKNLLFVSYVGYHSTSIHLSGTEDSLIRIGLHLAPVQLPEYFVVANEEDPTIQFMRKAIKRRHLNYQGLRNYEVTVYRRNLLYSGERIIMVDEQFVKQAHEKGHKSKDIILATYKTENIKNKPVLFRLNLDASLIFTTDNFDIRIGRSGNTIIIPLADNALQYYDFKLLNTKTANKEISHTIQIIPRSSLTPLLKRRILVDDATCAIVGADIESNDGWNFPLIQKFYMKILQTSCNYNGFWIPQYSEVELAGGLSALGGLLSTDQMKL